MATEDLTTYTEEDLTNRLSETSSTCTFTSARNNEETYLYDDKGVGHFGDFEHLSQAKIESVAGADCRGQWAIWGLSNTLDDFWAWPTGVYVRAAVQAGCTQLKWVIFDYGLVDWEESAAENINQDRYFTTKRAGSVGTCKIYSDAARTDLLVTLTIAMQTTTWRYIYPFSSANMPSDRQATGYSKDLDLQEVLPPMGLGLKLAMKGGIGRPPLGTGGASFGG